MYISYTYVDSVTDVPGSVSTPMVNGPAAPNLPGLKFGFALESQYPTDVPVMYGYCDDSTDPTTPGILAMVTKDQYDAAQVIEMQLRLAVAKNNAYNSIAAKRWAVETGGITISSMDGIQLPTPMQILTGLDDQNRIDAALTNMERYSVDSVNFKAANNNWVQLSYQNLKQIGGAVMVHVQKCFDNESIHSKAVSQLNTTDAAATYDYSGGWPPN